MVAAALLCVMVTANPAQEYLDPHLEGLKPLLGMTFKGVFKNSTPESPLVDVAHWERALNGKAVRLVHSLNNGMYGGESIFRWDEEKKAVTYHYFTTADFMTVGTVEFKPGKIVTHEKVVGQAGGIATVDGETTFTAEGGYVVRAESKTADGKTNVRETTYKRDLNSRVVFK